MRAQVPGVMYKLLRQATSCDMQSCNMLRVLWCNVHVLCASAGELTEDPAKLKRAVQLRRMSREESAQKAFWVKEKRGDISITGGADS